MNVLIDLDLVYSHLNSLVPQFNKVAKEQLIDNLGSRADGETVVDMLKEFNSTTLQVISVVCEWWAWCSR